MRLILLTSLIMVAFAANSVLNRLALVDAQMDALVFAALRLISGAVALAVLVGVQRRGFAIGGGARLIGVLSLLLYLFGFSIAYLSLDAGVGALLLFGTVQITMFVAAALSAEHLPRWRWIGAGVAFSGLIWLLWPTAEFAPSWPHMLAMIAAGVGWGVYSLAGRGAGDAIQATAMNFILCAPVGLILLVFIDTSSLSGFGVALALISGVVTSGIGYALWYSVLPALGASRAAVIQLTVPVLATLGGLALLAEPVGLRLILATLLVLGGVGISLRKPIPKK